MDSGIVSYVQPPEEFCSGLDVAAYLFAQQFRRIELSLVAHPADELKP
jgi:hypothetical protein